MCSSRLHLQYASKLYIELQSMQYTKLIRPGIAPILCLLGDICHPTSKSGRAFLTWCGTNWDHVLWVPGAHEVSRGSIQQMHELTGEIPRLHVMMNRAWKQSPSSDYVVFGTPLVTDKCVRWLDGHMTEAEEMNEKAIVLSYGSPLAPISNKMNRHLIRSPTCAWLVGNTDLSYKHATSWYPPARLGACFIGSNSFQHNAMCSSGYHTDTNLLI